MLKIIIALTCGMLLIGCRGMLDGAVEQSSWNDISTGCIEGHVYYRGIYQEGLAPKLNDDGTPCHCSPESNQLNQR